MGQLCAMGVAPIAEGELDDVLTYLARYMRQQMAWLEDQSMTRIWALAESCNRLLALENGKRPALDISSSGEENR